MPLKELLTNCTYIYKDIITFLETFCLHSNKTFRAAFISHKGKAAMIKSYVTKPYDYTVRSKMDKMQLQTCGPP